MSATRARTSPHLLSSVPCNPSWNSWTSRDSICRPALAQGVRTGLARPCSATRSESIRKSIVVIAVSREISGVSSDRDCDIEDSTGPSPANPLSACAVSFQAAGRKEFQAMGECRGELPGGRGQPAILRHVLDGLSGLPKAFAQQGEVVVAVREA